MTRAVADAYTDTGGAWAAGPELVYGRLATVLLDHAPVPVTDRRVVAAELTASPYGSGFARPSGRFTAAMAANAVM